MNYTSATDAHRHLVAAILEQAVMDYKLLFHHGLIRNGQATDDAKRLHARYKVSGASGYATIGHVSGLCSFFQPGGMLEFWVSIADLAVSPEALRRGLQKWEANQANGCQTPIDYQETEERNQIDW